MKFSIIFIFLCTSNIYCCNAVFSLISNYLHEYNINLCYFFTCWMKHELAKLNRIMSNLNIRSSIITSKEKLNENLIKSNLTYFGYILDFSCKKFENILVENTDHLNFRLTRPWLIISKISNLDDSYWEHVFQNVKIRMDSNIKIAIPRGTGDNVFKLLDIYNPGFKLGGKSIISDIGFWNGTQLHLNKSLSLYTRRKNMTTVTIRSASVVLETNHSGSFEEYMSDSRYKHLDPISKFHYPIFLMLQEIHNFSHNLTVLRKWFGDAPSGVTEGVAKMLYEGEIDISSTGGSQQPTRIDFMDFLMPSYHYRPSFIFRNPRTYDLFSKEYLKPFAYDAWAVVTASVLLICFLLKLVHNIESTIFNTGIRYSWATTILITISPIFQQGSHLSPSHPASRLIFFMLLLISILTFNYYTSSILTSLLSNSPVTLRTLDELGHSKLEIGIEYTPYVMTWFAIRNDSDVQYIYKHKVFPPSASAPNSYTLQEGLAKVQKGGFAFHILLDSGYPIIARTYDQDAICDLCHIPMIPPALMGNLIQKRSQYYELFHVTLRKAKQAGLINRISLIWESKTPQCFSNARATSIGIDQMFMAYFLLVVGMILSLLFFVIEIIWFKWDLNAKFGKH